MKEATYTLHEPISAETLEQIDALGYKLEGNKLTVPYDPYAPCRVCHLAVTEASVGGTDICPWCDTGHYRDGCQWDMQFRDNHFVPKFPHYHPR